MNEPQPANVSSPGLSADAKNAGIVYILYLASFVVGVTCLVGVVMAYVHRNAAPEWLQSHYRYQIRTFWIGLLYVAVGAIAIFAVVGALVWLFTAIWFIVRCVKGLKQIQQGVPVPKPASWLW